MAPPFTNSDEPVSPTGRLFLRPELNTVIHSAFGFKNPINISAVKSSIASSLMVQHPRFRSLLVVDKYGVEHWRPTKINIDRHFIIVNENNNNADDVSVTRFINDYIAEMSVSSTLSSDKPLWEIHLLLVQKCMVFRFHHALGDGISLMSLLLADCSKGKEPLSVPPPSTAPKMRKMGWMEVVVGLLYGLIFCVEMVLRGLCVRDRKTVIAGGDGVELWPRKMATARFLIDDMKVIKSVVSNATINDVLFGVISAGLSRYLDHHSPKSIKEGTQITGVAIVNVRPQPGLQELSEMMKRSSTLRWGNKFGMLLLPVNYCCKSGVDSLQYVRHAKKMIDKKKRSFEAHFVRKIVDLVMSWRGPQVASSLNYRLLCNTTFTISNVVGPKEEITIAKNPVTFIRANTSSLPHALTMHMTSYGGKGDMQILVAKDIIPDPEFLAKCFEDALLEMRQTAAAAM